MPAPTSIRAVHLPITPSWGGIYSRDILGYARPRVGLLSIGTEETKGNELTLDAFKLCKQTELNFIGNVEGHDLFNDRWTWSSATDSSETSS